MFFDSFLKDILWAFYSVSYMQDSDGTKMVNEYVRVSSIGRGSYGKVV